MQSAQIARTVTDIRVAGSVGEKPLTWSRTLRQVNSISVGQSVRWSSVWSFSYKYVLTQQFLGNSALDDPIVRYPSGVAIKFDLIDSSDPTHPYAKRAALCPDRLILTQSPDGQDHWELQSADGQKVYFEPLTHTSEAAYPVRIVDSHGLQVSIAYDSTPAPRAC
jgi:hypothetical protein